MKTKKEINEDYEAGRKEALKEVLELIEDLNMGKLNSRGIKVLKDMHEYRKQIIDKIKEMMET